jgi:hypothetical protein
VFHAVVVDGVSFGCNPTLSLSLFPTATLQNVISVHLVQSVTLLSYSCRGLHSDVIRRFLRSLEANTGIIPEIRPHNCFRTLPFHFVIYLSQQSHHSSPSQNGVIVPSILRYHPKSCHSSFQECSDILTLATYHLTNGELSFPS